MRCGSPGTTLLVLRARKVVPAPQRALHPRLELLDQRAGGLRVAGTTPEPSDPAIPASAGLLIPGSAPPSRAPAARGGPLPSGPSGPPVAALPGGAEGTAGPGPPAPAAASTRE